MRTAVFGLLIVAVMASCGPSYTERQRQWRHDLAQGRTHDAERAIDDAYDGTIDRGVMDVGVRDSLIWYMERGSAAMSAGDQPAAIRWFDRAAITAEAHRPVALAREIGTWLLNDQIRTYDAWPHEHALIDAQRLLAHIELAQRADGTIPGEKRHEDRAFFQFERAVNVGRRLSLTLPQWIQEQGWKSYPDESFGRLLGAAAVLALPPEQRTGSDFPAADTALRLAQQAYRTQAARRTDHAPWAPAAEPETLRRMREKISADGVTPNPNGSLLLLDLVDYVPQLEQLRFTLIAGHYTRKASDGRSIRIGHFPFWVEGPGVGIISLWPLLPWPGEWIKPIAPGGLAVFAFEVPVHADARSRPTPSDIILRNSNGGEHRMALEPLGDPESLARGTLAERQPGIVLKTLARAAAKQIGVGVLSQQAHERDELLGFAVNLIGSLLASWSEQADLRSWATLPSRIDGAFTDLAPGTYTIERPGAATRSVIIRAGRTAIIPLRTYPSIALTPGLSP